MAAGRFKPGDRVRVLTGDPTGHCRTPYYLRGKQGVIEAVAGLVQPSQVAERTKRLGISRPLMVVGSKRIDISTPPV